MGEASFVGSVPRHRESAMEEWPSRGKQGLIKTKAVG